MKKYVLVTGSCGLIGTESCLYFHERGYSILGIDNDMRSYFFGSESSTIPNREFLIKKLKNYEHYEVDIRDRDSLKKIFKKYGSRIECVIHTAAQPSHDWASIEPTTDFTINANGTLNLLEETRNNCKEASFIFTSTNKVYGDRPNGIYEGSEFVIDELDSRYEAYYKNSGELYSVSEDMSIDMSKHSLFGSSKLAADVMVQEYGKYFGMNTVSFRGGCLTGSHHKGAKLHGFMSYLMKCIKSDIPYTVFGYKGKQVRDNIDSWDLVNAFWYFHQEPSGGEVYNIGGGRENSISVLEVIELMKRQLNSNWNKYEISDKNRIGDHIWYITDLKKFKSRYPNWKITKNINQIIKEMI